ncbi:hypothetical protein BSKO_03295 [Bryopsis sp. KO-2023]|nr:hypothetical protein BSKO_03295 [Bryopsis sp. KO-2023]
MERRHGWILAILLIGAALPDLSLAGWTGVDRDSGRGVEGSSKRRLLDDDGKEDESGPSCVCIFDVDGTVWLSENGDARKGKVAGEAVGVINKCKDKGYGVAIASGSPENDVKKVLQKQVNGDIFNEDFFQSGAFRAGNLVKSTELNSILDFFDVEDPGCAMFFDDEDINEVFSILTGVTHHNVDESIGVTMKDLKRASENVPSGCGCPEFK